MNIIPLAKNSQKPATIALSVLAFGIIAFVTLMTPSLIYPEVRASAAESADENIDTDTAEQLDDTVSEADSSANNPDTTSNTPEPANTPQDDTTSDSVAQPDTSNDSTTQDQASTNDGEQQIAQTDAAAPSPSPTADVADSSTKNPDADPAGNMPGNGENQFSDKEGILQPDGPLSIDHSLAGGGLTPLQPTDSSLSDGENTGRVE